MFTWEMSQLTHQKGWRLDELYQRTIAAQTLGYEVVIEADENGMKASYRKSISIPYHWEN